MTYIVAAGSAGKQRYRITDLYTNAPTGWYRYSHGFNIRAFIAYALGLAPNMPGFINAIVTASGKPAPVPDIASKIYAFSWFTGLGVSLVAYWLLNWFWPAKGCFINQVFHEEDYSEYEQYGLAHSPRAAHVLEQVVVDEKEQEQDGKMDEEEDGKKGTDGQVKTTVVDVPELSV